MKKLFINLLTVLLLITIVIIGQKAYLYFLVYRPLVSDKEFKLTIHDRSINTESEDNVVFYKSLYLNKNFIENNNLEACEITEDGRFLHCDNQLTMMSYTNENNFAESESHYVGYGLYKISYEDINHFFGVESFSKKYNMALNIDENINLLSKNEDLNKKIVAASILSGGDYNIYSKSPKAVSVSVNVNKTFSLEVEVGESTYVIFSTNKELFEELLNNIYFDMKN